MVSRIVRAWEADVGSVLQNRAVAEMQHAQPGLRPGIRTPLVVPLSDTAYSAAVTAPICSSRSAISRWAEWDCEMISMPGSTSIVAVGGSA